jgi:hypothetical protein
MKISSKKISDYDKIMKVLEAKRISVNQAEIDIGVKAGVIGKLPKRRKGFGRMHRANTEKFIKTFNVNPKWWEGGEGEMFLDGASGLSERATSPDHIVKFLDIINRLIDKNDKLMEEIDHLKDDLSKLTDTRKANY